jgi:hypothetical protein
MMTPPPRPPPSLLGSHRNHDIYRQYTEMVEKQLDAFMAEHGISQQVSSDCAASGSRVSG